MKKYETPWSVGSMFICTKCGVAFDIPENAENLKKDLRGYLKTLDAHQKIRVITSGCLNICEKTEQAVVFQPNDGATEVFTVDKNFGLALNDLKSFLDKKI